MSMNKVILIGNVGKDPEVKYFDSGSAQATFPLATSERGYKLQNGTEVPERTEWHNIVIRKDSVPFVEKYVKKGSQVYVEGKIRYRSYDDATGSKRYVTEILCDKVEFFGSRRSDRPAEQPQAPAPAVSNAETFDASSPAADGADDLPF